MYCITIVWCHVEKTLQLVSLSTQVPTQIT